MKEIALTQGQFAQVDDSVYKWINQWKWNAIKGKDTYYAVRSIRINGKCKRLWMHRVIMDTPDNMNTDHQDFNGLNCQRSNLRNCTRSQNAMNRRPHGRSQYIGVSYVKGKTHNGKRYDDTIIAYIRVKGELIYLGCFKSELEAAKVRDNAAIMHFGEFASLNLQ